MLLRAGGAIVIFARPRLEIGTGVDNYSWLPRRPFEVAERSGKSVQSLDRDGPFRTYFETYGGTATRDSEIFFQVVLQQIPDDLPGSQILAVNRVGEPTGLLYRELNGTVAVIPPVSEVDDRFRPIFGEIVRRLRERRSSLDLAPEWVRSLPPLPGETDHQSIIHDIQKQIQELEGRRDSQLHELEGLRNLKALLWESGSLGLQPAVQQAFGVLGFQIGSAAERPEAGAACPELRCDDLTVFYEVDASEESVHLDGFRKLHETVTEALLERGIEATGILVGNGARLKPLDAPERRASFTESCLNGCAKFGYAAVATPDLYRAVETVLRDPADEARKAAIRKSLLDAGGRWSYAG
jgi:hypothetical protein